MRLITVLILSMLVLSCGMFKKTLNKSQVDFEKELLEVEREQKDIEVRNRDAYTDILEITIRKPVKEVEAGKSPEIALHYENLHDAVLQQIIESSEILIRSEKRGRSAGETLDRTLTETKSEKTEKEAVKTSDLDKDSNTTLISNIPWYTWVLGVGGVLGLAYLVMKRYGVL